MSTLQDRIRQVMDAEAGGLQSRFADAIGQPRYTVNRVLVEGREPTASFIAGILTAYPRLNPWWLLLGHIPKAGPPAEPPVEMYAPHTPSSHA